MSLWRWWNRVTESRTARTVISGGMIFTVGILGAIEAGTFDWLSLFAGVGVGYVALTLLDDRLR